MAGKRRAAGKPMVRVARAERRQENLDADLAAAETLQDRVQVAADHVRSALVCNPDKQVADRVVDQLIKAAGRLYKQKTGAVR